MAEVVCCISCGRDTAYESGYCCKCSCVGGYGVQIDDRKDRPVFRVDGDSVCCSSMEIEDDYSENSMPPKRKKVCGYSPKEQTRHFKKMQTIYND